LENHHCATAFKILLGSNSNFLEKMSRNDFILFRKYTIHGILNTDMAEHTSMINTISFKLDKDDDFNPDEEERPSDFLDFFGLLLHTADLYTPAKEYSISRIWADRINQEFIEQLKCEEKFELPVTPFYKGLEDIVTRAKSESFFINCIVSPLWGLLDRILANDLRQQLSQIQLNGEKWKKLANGEKDDIPVSKIKK
jgi:hypothetical protein